MDKQNEEDVQSKFQLSPRKSEDVEGSLERLRALIKGRGKGKCVDLNDDTDNCKPVPLNLIPAGAPLTDKLINKKLSDVHISEKEGSYNEVEDSLVIPTNSINNTDKGKFRIGCSCSKCKYFNISGLEVKPGQSNKEPKYAFPIKPKEFIRQHVPKEERFNIKSIKLDTSLKSKSTSRQVLAHGLTKPTMAETFQAVPFEKPVHSALRHFNFKELKPIQTYALPAIMKHSNVCMVSASTSGKTLSYIFALCSFKLDENMYVGMPDKDGPIAVILCPNSLMVENIQELFKNFSKRIKFKSAFKCSMAFNMIDRKFMQKFNKHSDVLITTPSALITLLKRNVITMKRLRHLIVEDLDKILREFNESWTAIFSLINEMLSHRHLDRNVQFISTSQTWTVDMEKTIKRFYAMPVICIANPMQAAVYGTANIRLIEVPSSQKAKKVVDVTRDLSLVQKCLIVCNMEDIDSIKKEFKSKGMDVLCVDESMTVEDISELEHCWYNKIAGKNTIMVCTDQVLIVHYNIRDAWLLVNYSIPSTWSTFTRRFAYLLDHYKSPYGHDKDAYSCRIITLIDENTFKVFPRINNFFESLGATLPQKLIDSAHTFYEKNEEAKVAGNVKLCSVLKTFGKCSILNCYNRHTLNKEVDTAYKSYFPSHGKLKYTILAIINVNRFLVRPIEYIDYNNVTHDMTGHFQNILHVLSSIKCYDVSTTVRVHEIYVYVDGSECSRCIVKKIVSMDSITKEPVLVEIQSLDYGFKKVVQPSTLMILPNVLKDLPPTYVELYIANIIPSNNEPDWSNLSISYMGMALNQEKYKNKDCYCLDNIRLQIGNTIWVDDLHLNLYLYKVRKEVTLFRLRKFLTEMKLITVCEQSLANLYSLCEKSGIPLPAFVETDKEITRDLQIEPQWAHLSADECDAVYFSSGINPELFYVRLCKYTKLHLKLQREIQKEVTNPLHKPLGAEDVEVGKYYLAKEQGGAYEYCRVLVLSLHDARANCFFVDDGIRSCLLLSDLKHLSNYYKTVLPFQAIECSLYGIQPISSWTDEINILYDYCFEPNTDYFRKLYVFNLRNEPGRFGANCKYKITLVDRQNEQPTIINKLLVDCGLAISEVEFNIDLNLLDKCAKQQSHDDQSQTNEEIVEEEDDDGWDFELFDGDLFFKELTGKKRRQLRGVQEEGTSRLHPIVASPAADYYQPDILWFQTKNNIRLDISLVDVKEYSLKLVASRLLSFQCEHKGRLYKLSLQLFDSVQREFDHKAKARYIKVKFTKNKDIEWPRLVFTKDIMRNIKYNINKIYIEEDVQTKRRFLDIDQDDQGSEIEDEKNCILDADMFDSFSDTNSETDYTDDAKSD